MLLSTLGAVGLAVLYTNHVDQRSRADVCALLEVVDPTTGAEPSTERGRDVAAAADRYRARSHC